MLENVVGIVEHLVVMMDSRDEQFFGANRNMIIDMLLVNRHSHQLLVCRVILSDLSIRVVVHLEVIDISGERIRVMFNQNIFFGLRNQVLRKSPLELVLCDDPWSIRST